MNLNPDNVLFFDEDFSISTDIFNEDSDRLIIVKHILKEHLTNNERLIFLASLHYKSTREYAMEISCTYSTLVNYLNSVKNKVIHQYELHTNH